MARRDFRSDKMAPLVVAWRRDDMPRLLSSDEGKGTDEAQEQARPPGRALLAALESRIRRSMPLLSLDGPAGLRRGGRRLGSAADDRGVLRGRRLPGQAG